MTLEKAIETLSKKRKTWSVKTRLSVADAARDAADQYLSNRDPVVSLTASLAFDAVNVFLCCESPKAHEAAAGTLTAILGTLQKLTTP